MITEDQYENEKNQVSIQARLMHIHQIQMLNLYPYMYSDLCRSIMHALLMCDQRWRLFLALAVPQEPSHA